MAIVFDWYENPNASSEEEAALHPRIFMNGKVIRILFVTRFMTTVR